MGEGMARTRYIIIFERGKWKISVDGRDFGLFPTQRIAIRVAVDAAHQAGQEGQDVQVVVQETDHKFRVEWTYGHDPYPLPDY